MLGLTRAAQKADLKVASRAVRLDEMQVGYWDDPLAHPWAVQSAWKWGAMWAACWAGPWVGQRAVDWAGHWVAALVAAWVAELAAWTDGSRAVM